MHILGEMGKALTSGRSEFSAHAPRIETMQIAVDKIREVIGSGGKVIRGIVEESGAKVDINDDGTIKIASANSAAINVRHANAQPILRPVRMLGKAPGIRMRAM